MTIYIRCYNHERIKAVVRLDESGIVLSKLRNGRVLISEKMSATPTVYCTYSVYHNDMA